MSIPEISKNLKQLETSLILRIFPKEKTIQTKLLYLETIVKSLIINYQIVAIRLLTMKYLHLRQLKMALKFIEMTVQMQFK